MSTETTTIEGEDGGTVVITEVPPSDEGASEAIAEAIEEASSDAVEIARIEAERDVTIAAIHADTETTRVEVLESTNAEINEMRERIIWLEGQLTSTQEQNLQLLAQSTPPPSPEPEPVTEVTEVVETTTIDTSETNTETSDSTQTEAPEKSEAEEPAQVEVVKAKRRLRFL